MTNYDRILAEARQLLTPEEQEKLAMDLASRQVDPELEASLERGVADMREGRVTDFDEFMSELEAEDRHEANVG
jgi:hypothetical protein